MKFSILSLVFWSLSLVANGEEFTKVTVNETEILLKIPYFSLETPEGSKAYEVILVSSPIDRQPAFYVDWRTLQEIPLMPNSFDKTKVITDEKETRIVIPFFILETPKNTGTYKVELFSPNVNEEPVFYVDWPSLQEIILPARIIEGLVFMREEEKMARDIYTRFYQIWGKKIFKNISESEQSHTDAMLNLLDYYQIPDPIGENEEGIFTQIALQNLYDSLVESGSFSLTDALLIGAEIEEIDLIDIENLAREANHHEIIVNVYQNLMKGSENHLRAFVQSLEKQGIAYTPQHLTPAEYESIINNSK